MNLVRTIPILLVAAITAAPAAAEDPRQSRWFWPTLTSWKKATMDSLKSPATWGPAAGSALFLATNLDKDASQWAVENTPLFGSQENAADWSDRLRTASHVGMIGTTFAVTSERAKWKRRLQVTLIEHGSAITATTVTTGLKGATGRARPDGSDDESFPSRHTSSAFAYTAGTNWNLAHSNLTPGMRRGLGAGLGALAAGCGWARVEAGKHYPSDVLFGAALGNFTASVINRVFLDERPEVSLALVLNRENAAFALRWSR